MRADWLDFQKARRIMLEGVPVLPETACPLLECLGHVLAEDVTAPLDLPPWDNSAMDGFAVRSQDVRGASHSTPRELEVIEDIPAGALPRLPLLPGTASRVMTGAPVPAGADGVVRLEHTDGGTLTDDGRGTVRILDDTDAGKNIRKRGEDVRTGNTVLERGTQLGAAHLGVAASVGRASLNVVRRPVVAVLTSGDELVDLDRFDEVLQGRRIVSSNSYSLAAQLLEASVTPRLLGIAKDSPQSLREHILRAQECDALITTAGVSVGAHDYVREVLRGLGLEPAFWRVRIRPGSPLGFGWIAALGGIPWFGLPGNPVSCMVTFEAFVRPALLRMGGAKRVFRPTVPARLVDTYAQSPGLVHFVRVKLGAEQNGLATARLTGGQGSGILTSMAAADGLMVVPATPGGAAPGDVLPVIVLGGAPLREEPGY